MRRMLWLMTAMAVLLCLQAKEPDMEIYGFTATRIDGKEIPLSDYRGKVLLIVNTASKCGFTPQYEGLEKLFETYRERGFMILGFPCNQFGSQEPGNETEVARFCRVNYGVSFDMFAKIDVNGEQTHPLYRYLKKAAKGIMGSEAIKWNFTKFLIDREGNVVERYAPATTPESIAAEIEKLL